MKKFIVLLFVLLGNMQIFAQKISGTVTDESGEIIPGVFIKSDNASMQTISNKDGYFQFKPVKPGIYSVSAEFSGYEKLIQTVQIADKDIELNLTLKLSEFLINEVIVSAIKADSNTPIAFTDFSKKEIEDNNNGQDIPYILNISPSMVVSSDGGTGIGYTSMRIRGTDMTRINVTVDGIPLNDAESHGVWWVNMPDFASSLDNVQIQRGVGTSTNGSGAFGANINLTRKAFNQKAYSEINFTAGSFNTQKASFMAGSGLLNNTFAFDVRLSKIHTDGYIDRARADLKSIYLSAVFSVPKTTLKISYQSGNENTYQAWYGVPKDSLKTRRTYNPYTYKNEIDFYTQSHLQSFLKHRFNKNLLLDMAIHYTHGEGYYEQEKEDQNFADYGLSDIYIGSDTVTHTDLIRRKWLDNDFIGIIYALNYRKKNLNINVGGAWNTYSGNHFGHIIWSEFAANGTIDYEWYKNTGNKTDLNNYFKINFSGIKGLNLWADIQYRTIHYAIDGIHDDLRDISQNRSFNFINPKVGISFNISKNSNAYFSFATAGREPSRSDFRDADDDEHILSETLYDFESCFKYFTKNYAFDLNVFYMNYKNQLILTGEINDVGAYIMSNVPKSYRAGVELSGHAVLSDFADWKLNAAFSKNIIKNLTGYVDNWDTWGQETEFYPQTNISFSPSVVAGSDLSFHLFKGFETSLISKYVGKQYIDNTSSNERALKAYFVNNLQIRYTVHTKSIQEIGFHVFVNNLFNELYESNAWVYRYIYGGEHYVSDGYFPQAGIHFLAGIGLKI